MTSPKFLLFTALCTPVTFEVCSSRGFTQTVFPNLLNQENEAQAMEAFNQVAKNVFNQICQESALTYLCSLHFPKCDLVTGDEEFPCFGLCEGMVQASVNQLNAKVGYS